MIGSDRLQFGVKFLQVDLGFNRGEIWVVEWAKVCASQWWDEAIKLECE